MLKESHHEPQCDTAPHMATLTPIRTGGKALETTNSLGYSFAYSSR